MGGNKGVIMSVDGYDDYWCNIYLCRRLCVCMWVLIGIYIHTKDVYILCISHIANIGVIKSP